MFSREVDFSDVAFNQAAHFQQTRFGGTLLLMGSRFLDAAEFRFTEFVPNAPIKSGIFLSAHDLVGTQDRLLHNSNFNMPIGRSGGIAGRFVVCWSQVLPGSSLENRHPSRVLDNRRKFNWFYNLTEIKRGFLGPSVMGPIIAPFLSGVVQLVPIRQAVRGRPAVSDRFIFRGNLDSSLDKSNCMSK
jgi:hypothetical protein